MGRPLGNESGWLYSRGLMRLPLADGKPITDKPIKDRRRRMRGGCGKSPCGSPLGEKHGFFPSVPRRFFVRVLRHTTRTKNIQI